MRGGHCVRAFSVTQHRVTLSSAEAELGAAVRVACEVIGLSQLGAGLGLKLEMETHLDGNVSECAGRVHVDSSAALGVIGRKGNGKLRHIRIGQLWVQQLAEEGEMKFVKIAGVKNPADLFTKYLPGPKIA